jgi:hypothetical protein
MGTARCRGGPSRHGPAAGQLWIEMSIIDPGIWQPIPFIAKGRRRITEMGDNLPADSTLNGKLVGKRRQTLGRSRPCVVVLRLRNGG